MGQMQQGHSPALGGLAAAIVAAGGLGAGVPGHALHRGDIAPASSRSLINVLLRSCGEKPFTVACLARFCNAPSTAWSLSRRIVIFPALFTGQSREPSLFPRTASQSTTAAAAPPS